MPIKVLRTKSCQYAVTKKVNKLAHGGALKGTKFSSGYKKWQAMILYIKKRGGKRKKEIQRNIPCKL